MSARAPLPAALLLAASLAAAGCTLGTGAVAPAPVAPGAAPAPPAAATETPPARPPVPAGARVRDLGDYVAVVPAPGDTLASLAATHLGNPGLDWMIAEFNGVPAAVPGEALAIPRRPFRRGGLTPAGYQTVPVLSYHNFAERSTDRMTVSREAFEAQMRLLREKGYRVISLEALFDFLDFQGQIPEKSVVITIDDGWRSLYDIAFPILKRYGYPATLFVYTQLVSGSGKTLSWAQIREMADQGLDVQCHAVTHRNLAERKEGEPLEAYLDAVERELRDSSRLIEQKLGRRPRYLAYPYGDTDPVVTAFLRRQGYRGGFTVVREANPFFVSNYRLRRSMIYGDYDLARFERNLAVSDRRALR